MRNNKPRCGLFTCALTILGALLLTTTLLLHNYVEKQYHVLRGPASRQAALRDARDAAAALVDAVTRPPTPDGEAENRQLDDARRTIADRDREIARLEAALKARRDGSARDADNARRRLRQLERDADEDPRRSPGTTQSQRSLRRERFRKARSDRATDVTRIMSLRDSLETLRLHTAEELAEEPGERC